MHSKPAMVLLALGLFSCGADDGAEVVAKHVEVVGVGAAALAGGSLTAVNGTYTSCAGHSGAWSVAVSGSPTLANPVLSVRKNDAACQLTITELVTAQTFTSTPSIALGGSYVATASAFAVGNNPVAFHANAKLDATTFASDFQISIVHSADVSAVDGGSAAASYATVQASTLGVLVAPPDYTLSLTNGTPFTLQVDVDDVVQSVSGVATLTAGARTGEKYVVDQGTLPASPTYANVLLAFTTGTQRDLSGTTIPAAHFGLVGQDLTAAKVRTVIISHTELAVTSFEIFKITFQAP